MQKNPNQSVLQFIGSGGSIPSLKLDEPSQIVQISIMSSAVRLGLGLDGHAEARYSLALQDRFYLHACGGKTEKSVWLRETIGRVYVYGQLE